jgi:hypothetical protein
MRAAMLTAAGVTARETNCLIHLLGDRNAAQKNWPVVMPILPQEKRQQLQWFWPEGVGGDRRAKKGKQAVNALIGIAVAYAATRCDIF